MWAESQAMRTLLLATVLSLAVGCADAPAETVAAAPAVDELHSASLVGAWRVDDGSGGRWTLNFSADGTCGYLAETSSGNNAAACGWSNTPSTLTFVSPGWGVLPAGWAIQGQTLTLTSWFAGDWTRVP
jgi:hypothetical protein